MRAALLGRGPDPAASLSRGGCRARAARRVGPHVALLLLGLVSALPCQAQLDEWLSIGVSAARAEIRMEGFRARDEIWSGTLLGIEGRATLWRFEAQGEYREGRLEPQHVEGGSNRVVSARASLGISPFSWLTIAGGPRFTVVDTSDGDRDIVRWRIEARGTGPLIAGIVRGFASIGGSVGGTDLRADRALDGGGGEIGIVVGSQGRPLWGRLGYRMERESLVRGSSETLETTFLSFGVAVPRDMRR